MLSIVIGMGGGLMRAGSRAIGMRVRRARGGSCSRGMAWQCN